jgi:hypothetical protein
MLPVTSNVNAMPRKLSCKLEIGSDTITDVKQLTYSSDWSGDITIGQVVSSYINVTVPTPSFSIAGADVLLSMGIGSTVEWVSIGQFAVDENSVRHRQGYSSFSAYDALHNSVNIYEATVTFPATLQAICDDVCYQVGITSATLGVSFTVQEDILSGYTLRDVLGFIAAMCGCNAYLSPSGALDLRWFSASGYTADGTRANVPYIGENDCTVNRLICQTADGVITSGSGEGIYFTCPIMTQSRLDALQAALSGFTYRKADVDIPYGNFCLQSGDVITVTTTGSNLTVPIMANSWTYDGGLSSAVSAYGVSDYSGTANNAEQSVSAQRVLNVLNERRAVNRAQTIVSQEVQHATELITGATGGYIKLEFGGNGKTAQLLVMDQPSMEQALNVWIFNQNGLGHIQRQAVSDPFSQVNVALTREGTVVAERIAGQKITGVRLETTAEGTGSLPQVIVEDGSYTINKVSNGVTSTVGRIIYLAPQAADEVDSIDIQVDQGGSVRIGTLSGSAFIYYSDLTSAPSGAKDFQLYGDVKLMNGDLFLGNASLLDKLAELEQRIEDLENR